MQVSRADIPTNKLVDYGEGSFLKLPVDVYMGELGMEPIPPQIALVNGINNPKYRFGVAALSRRTGKTFISNVVGQLVALVPGCSILIVAPNYSLTQISWDLQHDLIRKFGIEVSKDNAKDKVVELINGSSIRLGSVNNINAVVGRSYDLVIFDEAALTDAGEDAFNVAIRPTLDKINSKALFISTPRGKQNWFSKFYDRGFSSEHPEWFSVKATWKDNPRMQEEDVKAARNEMTDSQFEQEYEASFSVFEGRIWHLDEENYIDEIPEGVVERAEVIAGLDLGYRDPTAFVVFLFDAKTDTLYLVDEYQDNEKTTGQQAEIIAEMIDKWEIEIIFIDSANQQQRFDFAHSYGIPTDNAKKDKLPGIGYVASLMENNKVKVLNSCRHAIYTIDQYKWDANQNLLKEKPVHDEASHMADAIRYALYSFMAVSLGDE